MSKISITSYSSPKTRDPVPVVSIISTSSSCWMIGFCAKIIISWKSPLFRINLLCCGLHRGGRNKGDQDGRSHQCRGWRHHSVHGGSGVLELYTVYLFIYSPNFVTNIVHIISVFFFWSFFANPTIYDISELCLSRWQIKSDWTTFHIQRPTFDFYPITLLDPK